MVLLELLVPSILQITSVGAAIVGGTIIAFLELVLENVLGVTPPIIDDTQPRGAEG